MSDERYEIRGKIGQGGVGAVYKAFDTSLNREVAIKRVLADGGEYEDQADATKQLLKEATALSAVQHPHIVTVYDAGIDDEGPFVVMEIINGKTLDEMVEASPVTWDDLKEIALQTQEALIAAQDLNLVHRDLKPSNVMVCWLPSGKFQVKIVDFGLAKFSETPSLQTIDHGDAVFGSIFFMAPEQFERTPLDQRTDMYAMGCLYYYALTGEYPFSGETAPQVMASHLQHSVTPLHELRPDIPQWGADWVMWHINRGMDDRPTNAREALERFLILDKQSTQPVTVNAQSMTAQPASSGGGLIFPSAAGNNPGTGAVQAQQPNQITSAVGGLNTKTQAQPIVAPGGVLSPHTQAQRIATQQMEAQQAAATALPAQPIPGAATQTAQIPQTVQTTPMAGASATNPGAATTQQGGTAGNQTSATPTRPIKKKGLSKQASVALISILSVAVIVAGIVVYSIVGKNNKTEAINKVVEAAKVRFDEGTLQDGFEISQEHLQGVLDRLTSVQEDDNRTILYQILVYAKPLGGYDANQVILDHALGANGPYTIRASILDRVMTQRPSIGNIEPLLKYARSADDESMATAAVKAARFSATGNPADDFIDDFLRLISSTNFSGLRAGAEKAVHELISESKNKASFEKPLVGAYKTAVSDSAKYAFLRLLGSAGGSEAAATVKDAYENGDNNLKNAAIAALAKWTDDSQFEYLVEIIEKSNTDQQRSPAFNAAANFLREQAEKNNENLVVLVNQLADVATSSREKEEIIRLLIRLNHKWALEILKKYEKDPDDTVADKAERAIRALELKLGIEPANS